MIVGLIVGFLARSWFSLALIALAGPIFRVGFLLFTDGRIEADGAPLTRGEVGMLAFTAYAYCLIVAAVVYGLRLAYRATRRASH